jgi:hypothetical protein
MTDREKLSFEIERQCLIQSLSCEEKENSITVAGHVKYLFTADGEIKSIIRNGRAFGPDGERIYVAPKVRSK